MKLIQEISALHKENKQPENVEYRLATLKKFKENIIKFEEELLTALYADLGKNKKEAYLAEINESLEELEYQIKHLKTNAKPKKVKSTYQVYGTKSFICKKPKGKVLLIVPFNYPVNLCFLPLIGAIAAGNKVMIKMSSSTPNTNAIVQKTIQASFSEDHVYFLAEKLDNYDDLFMYEPNMVFFTGSTGVGKKIEKTCVEKNIDYITEMGGECPCVIYDVYSDVIYDRIVWAKFLNAGQTCVSINYILYNQNIKDFKEKLISAIQKQFPEPLQNYNVPKLINKKAFDKMLNIIAENQNNIVYGGEYDEQRLIVEPTIIEVEPSQLKKYGEIFGPILLITKQGNDLNEYIKLINSIDASPLAAYFYATELKICEKLFNEINAGGYCFNDSLVHITNHHLPFGGVYTSGTGKYHGEFSFEAFSFIKPLLINYAKKNIEIKFTNNDIDLDKTKKMISLIKKFVK